MAKNDKISHSVIRRLPRYYRYLGELLSEGTMKISSRELAEKMKVTASQIRQDLNCFGGFGQQGYGYNVSELRAEIGTILGTDRQYKAVLIGAGNLGRALAMHIDYDKFGCRLCGIFDSNEKLRNTELGGIKIQDMSALPEFCRLNQPSIAILCVPGTEAKTVFELLAAQGVRAFWNFTHVDINTEHREDIVVENVHLGDSLMTLCYGLTIN